MPLYFKHIIRGLVSGGQVSRKMNSLALRHREEIGLTAETYWPAVAQSWFIRQLASSCELWERGEREGGRARGVQVREL